jgi:release factor glutamine methyltransferase
VGWTGAASPPSSSSAAGDLLRRAAVLLRRAGCETPRLDAEVLLTKVAGRTREDLLAHPDIPLTSAQASSFHDLIARRERHCPVAYLTGRREFMSLEFEVAPGVLIPRPETELLVEVAAGLVKAGRRAGNSAPSVLADVGTGSGIIAVTLGRMLPDASIFALDCSSTALAIARRNAERLGVGTQIAFRRGNLLAALAGERPRPVLDGVVANLPYVPDADWAGLPPDVRDYEPPESLRGGVDGLDLYRRLVAELPTYLAPGGFACLEIDGRQSREIQALLVASGLFRGDAPTVHYDLAGRARVVSVSHQRCTAPPPG